MPLIVVLLLHVDGIYQGFVIVRMYPVFAILVVFFIYLYHLRTKKEDSNYFDDKISFIR